MRMAFLLVACSSSATAPNDLAVSDLAEAACALAANTSATSTVTNGCALVDRDTSACKAARTAQGLTGSWLSFSCRVTLTQMSTYVLAAADSRPDYTSNYFAATDACYAAYTTM